MWLTTAISLLLWTSWRWRAERLAAKRPVSKTGRNDEGITVFVTVCRPSNVKMYIGVPRYENNIKRGVVEIDCRGVAGRTWIEQKRITPKSISTIFTGFTIGKTIKKEKKWNSQKDIDSHRLTAHSRSCFWWLFCLVWQSGKSHPGIRAFQQNYFICW